MSPRLTLAFGSLEEEEFSRLIDQLAIDLEAKGVGPGDRVAFRHPPTPEAAALLFAAWRIGASICPLSLRIPAAQIEAQLQRIKPRIYIDSFPICAPLWEPSDPLPFPAALLFTSGSTSQPKIAVLSLENLLQNASPACEALDLSSGDVWLLNLPLYHIAGLALLLRCALARARVVLYELDRSITHISVVPTQLYRAVPIHPSLKCLLIGGAPIPNYPERLPCYLTYGLTETSSLIVARRNPPIKKRPFSLGFPLPNREVRLTEKGEIQVRGGCLFQGYWENGKILRPFDPDGWFSTGDLGRIDKEGLTVLGRKDWQFISGGENIQPEEIESALLSLPGVLEATVVPVESAEFGQRPAAFLKASGQNEDSLKRALLERLPKFKIPVRFQFVEEFPKKELKVDRKKLIEIANKNFQ